MALVEAAQPWTRVVGRAGVMLCARHGEFALPGACAGCELDPVQAEPDEIGERIAAPEGCRTLEEHERWYTALADVALAEADRAAAPSVRTWHAEGIIAKHREVAIKANRAAAELARGREHEALVDARERRIRDRNRGAGH